MNYRGKVLSIGAGLYQHALDEIDLVDRKHFSLSITIIFGIEGEVMTELVTAVVCSPSWIESALNDEAVVRGGEIILMREYDPRKLARALENFAYSCTATNIKDVFGKFSRIGHSEFEDLDQPAALRQFLNDGQADGRIPLQRIDVSGRIIP